MRCTGVRLYGGWRARSGAARRHEKTPPAADETARRVPHDEAGARKRMKRKRHDARRDSSTNDGVTRSTAGA
jgi:hypothetical protein